MNEISGPVAAPETRLRRIWMQTWPQAIIGFGFALTIVWVFILGRGLFGLIKMAIA
jgi:hypothetical protein